ncbi:MAG: sugar ABC transporter ATP-binding protein [Opitutaceae bacterium]|nr:sugar ABC transporter ATP-binding protein [Opitutaceae bacterium]
MTRLRLTGIDKAFGATQALRGVSLAVAAGEVHALIGENGAGKSTLMKVLSGVVRPDAGTMELDGAPYLPSDTLAARRHGVAMIYQELSLAPHLSAWENIVLGSEPHRLGWLDKKEARARARGALARLAHGHLDLDRAAGEFSIAEQQVIEIARALLAEPRVLIMDEPTSSLTQADTERLFAVVRQLRAEGVSVIYISHFLEEVRQVADRFTVLKDGQTVGSGELAAVSQAEIVRLMVGREVRKLYPARTGRPGAVVLTLRAPSGPALELRAGEILGVAGLIGAGRTELLRAVFGLDKSALYVTTPARRWAEGVGFLSENRKEEGLMLPLSVAENTTLTKFSALARGGWLRTGGIEAVTADWIGRLGIKTRGPKQAVGELSGGNQQKVALARLLQHPAKILLLDEPTRGIDVGSKAQIYALIAQLAAEGRAVVLVSSYLPELFGLCDRIAVMRRGALVECRDRAAWTEPELMTVAVGAAA